MAARNHTVLQIRTISQQSIQSDLILTNEWSCAVVLMPILAKRKNFRDGYNKIAKFTESVLVLVKTCLYKCRHFLEHTLIIMYKKTPS